MTHWRTLALGALFASPLQAQSAALAASHVVSGIVYDSIAHAPLAGALVQVALADSAQRVFTATADAAGRYRVAGLPSGRFAIVFQHDALNALGLESPLFALELGVDTSVTANLAIPSGQAVRALRCTNPAKDAGDGMIGGYVFDARSEGTLAGAEVQVRWVEVTFQKGGLRQVPKRVTTTVGEDGTYLACGVASDSPVDIRVTRPGYRDIVAPIVVPAAGAARQDFRLADSAATRGSGSLAGHVVQEDGKPVAAGRASIAALGLDVAVSAGEFAIVGIPAGTWIVDARAIGYEAQSAIVHVAERSSASVTIPVAKKAQTLEAVNVVGTASRETRILGDIVARNRTWGGTTFLPGNSWLASADTPTDVLRAARGFSLKGAAKVEGRPYVTSTGRLAPCQSTSADAMKAGKEVAIYLDGVRYAGGLEVLNNDVLPRQVLAIEAYPDVVAAPMQWRTNDACAVIAVWTKR
ncbi:MAG: carboxypeptidase regulatory-like domain-containing protein [bacterium]